MINPNAYYTVQGWMLSELGLKGNPLAAYAIIYGFSQDGVSEYAGSSKYLCEWLGCSKKTILTTLADLTEKGYLAKKVIDQNGVRFCNYVAVRRPAFLRQQPGEEITPGGEEITPGVVKNLHQGGEEITPGWCKNYTGGGEENTPHNLLHNTSDNTRDKDIYSAPENNEPQEPAKKRGRKKKSDDEPKPAKKEYGEFKHVKLTDDELAKLTKKHGEEKTAQLIKYLDEYIEEKPAYKSQSHYLAIGRWVVDAVNERMRRSQPQQPARPAARGGYGGPVGPNGIPIDQSSQRDLDAIF